MIHIAPSILAADFSRLGDQVIETERAGAQRIHVDVMDGHFVPNLSMGPAIVAALRKVTRMPLEVHLMVEEPEKFVDLFLNAGADSLIAHQEVLLDALLLDLDLALCMTVHPGFSGQAFLRESPERIRKLKNLIDARHPKCELE